MTALGHNEENRANIRVSLSKWPVFILYIARYGPTGLLFVSQPSDAGAYKFRDGPCREFEKYSLLGFTVFIYKI